MEEFLYLKLGRGNCLAKYWLGGDNVLKVPAAAIYFRQIKTEEFRKIIRIPDGERERKKEEYKKLRKIYGMKVERRERILDKLNQVERFIEAGENAPKTGSRRTKFVTITRKKIYIYEPESRVSDLQPNKYYEYDSKLLQLSKECKNPALRRSIRGMTIRPKEHEEKIRHIPKVMRVKILKEPDVKDVPHVLATLPCNQYYTQGTCREIKPKKD